MQLFGDFLEFAFFHPLQSFILPLGVFLAALCGAYKAISEREEDNR